MPCAGLAAPFTITNTTYERIVELAGKASAGADRLVFLPYLNGERLAKQSNSRAQFVGLTSAHLPAIYTELSWRAWPLLPVEILK